MFCTHITGDEKKAADQVIQQYISAIGGLQNLNKVESLIIEGRVVMKWVDREKVIKKQIIIKKSPDCYRQEWLYPDKTIILSTSQFGSWQHHLKTGQVKGWDFPSRSPIFKLFHQSILGPFINPSEKGVSFEKVPMINPRKDAWVQLRMKYKDEEIADLFFNTKSGLLVKKTTPKYTILYLDYRRFSGLLFPCRIIEIVKGESYQHIDLYDSIKINPKIGDYLFIKPGHQKKKD